MNYRKMVVLTTILSLVLVSSLSLVGCSAKKDAYPNKPIELVVQAGAGGASDAFCRMVADILTKEKIINVPISVVNKTGGGGAVAFKYSAAKKGDPYVLQNAPSTFITLPLQTKDCPNYTEFTPIAMVATEPLAIIVKADSPYQSIEDLVEAAKTKPEGITWTFSSVGGFDHLLGLQFGKIAGGKFVYVPQTSDNESIVAILGGHVDVASMTMRLAVGQVQAGKMKILGMASQERAEKLPDVPTLKELGYDIVLGIPRAIAAPKDIPEDAETFLVDAFKKMGETERWKKYVEDEWLLPEVYYGDDFGAYLKTETEKVEPLLKDAGLIK
ncbi:Bug family tripartite tricarboxylate transporter substrate binding protein [Candidatus Formimonas warabiya]|uniref:Tripartite tricarboxylate transporter substrate binding protein n=1 Tax=Formimonas warabiya TaxID=1761012 RepID=A0A3G1KVM9_FORW1|nr:tripartite tricarboxylate transporter substrate binding protein [Candidatus Formimonas warabiya]ATW26583.1 hypothetical protein DCMF_19140 [Candidatus Formimonas warabiya]